MTGKAYICKLTNISPIEGADRIVKAEMFGETIITSIDNTEGTLGLLFDCETQLSHEFASNNNLYRHSELNVDKTVTGYFDDNRRVRPIKLKGVKCSAMFIPVDCLDFTGLTDGLVEGTEIDTFNGVPICSKFVNRETTVKGNQKSVKRNLVPTFKEHMDTDQLMRNLDKIKSGDLVVVTEKLHGTCMLPNQKVLMADGSYERINNIKEGDYVMGFDHSLNYTVPSKVIKTWNHGKTNDTWQEITFNRKGFLGNSFGRIFCTKEHQFFIDNKYIEAKDVKSGDKLKIVRTDYELEDFQKQVLIGKFLGDGSVTFREHGLSGKMTFGHSEKQLEYLKYCNNILGDIAYMEDNTYTSGYGSKIYRCHTKDTSFISEYFREYIVDGKRKLHSSIIKDLNPIVFAFLYMDNGSLSNIDGQNYRADLALCNFNKNSCEIIQNGLLKFGINSVLYNSDGYRIRMNFKDASIFYNMISPYVPESMQYKLPENLRGQKPFYSKSINKFTSYLFETEVISSKDTGKYNIRGYVNKIDITTETGNFFAGGILVHNSGRCGYLLTKLPKSSKWEKFVGIISSLLTGLSYREAVELENEDCFGYEFVTGSRRVVKSVGGEDTGKEGYYENFDIWTDSAKVFEGKLKKGETVYYEIVGQLPNGENIMNGYSNEKLKNFMEKKEYESFIKRYGTHTNFTYGTRPYEHEVYVYRITMTNEDGEDIDLSWEQVKLRCEKLGVKTVPEYLTKIITDDMRREDLEFSFQEMRDIPSQVFPEHIKEGICVRIENGKMNPTIFKDKTYIFKVLDNIIKDSGAVDSEDNN